MMTKERAAEIIEEEEELREAVIVGQRCPECGAELDVAYPGETLGDNDCPMYSCPNGDFVYLDMMP